VRVRDLETHFPIRRGLLRRTVGVVRAVDGISLDVFEGETLGLVGESGSGKTTFGRTVTRLVEPTRGTVEFAADPAGARLVDITRLSQGELRRVRRHMNMVFQDPLSSLNPRMSVKQLVSEPLVLHGVARGKALDGRVAELLRVVGLRPEHMDRFPHAFSGGQRQRIAIARALALRPRFVVCDEPVSALDASVKSQILNLFMDLQAAFRMAYLFISHDLAVVRHISDRIAVMYLGKVVELGPSGAVCGTPLHPYTEALLSVIPTPVPGRRPHSASSSGATSPTRRGRRGLRLRRPLRVPAAGLRAGRAAPARGRARAPGGLPLRGRAAARWPAGAGGDRGARAGDPAPER
jgi:ABC-type oligopeptide transport system ATPase subunit